MKRATDPAFFLSCCNHPKVRPYIGGDGQSVVEMDPARWERSTVLEWPEGCIAFERVSPGTYSAHWVLLPGAKDAVAMGKQALAYMFGRGADRIIGKTPETLRHARKAAQACGMQHLFTCDGWSHSVLSRSDYFHGRK